MIIYILLLYIYIIIIYIIIITIIIIYIYIYRDYIDHRRVERTIDPNMMSRFIFSASCDPFVISHGLRTDPWGNTAWTDSPLVQAAIHGDLAVLDGIHRLAKAESSAVRLTA